jgi:hypothetical protein
MLRFLSLPSILKFCAARRRASILCLFAFLTLLPSASGQDFTLNMAPFNPFAVNPGGTSNSTITLVAGTGFTGSVNLSCQVTSTLSGVTLPECTVSPGTVQPSASAMANIATEYIKDGTTVIATPGTYTVTVTGVGPSTTHQQAQTITVLAESPQFTITIQTAVLPSSVHAGSGGTGTVSINPIFGYSGTVTLSCASITPLVTVPPVCSFPGNPVHVSGGPATTTIQINTSGTIPITAVAHKRDSYALWLPLPLLMFAGLGAAATGKRSRKTWGVLAFLILGGSILLLPACNNLTTSTTSPFGITPNGTYTFTLMGVDTKGNISSNTGTANTAPTVTLTVD